MASPVLKQPGRSAVTGAQPGLMVSEVECIGETANPHGTNRERTLFLRGELPDFGLLRSSQRAGRQCFEVHQREEINRAKLAIQRGRTTDFRTEREVTGEQARDADRR